MKCCYIRDASFFSLLQQKLGAEIEFIAARSGDYDLLATADVIAARLPGPQDAGFQAALADLQHVARNPHGVPVVAFLATPDRQLLRTAVVTGAYDYFVESASLEELRIILRRATQFHELSREVERLKLEGLSGDFCEIAGTDSRMAQIVCLASKVAVSDASVLITGESGTGKEVLARAIHKASPRVGRPFVAVAVSSLPESLAEAELFGHERGAFTGAIASRHGRFEAAERGTIFLDEVGDLSPALQVKLLRVLQERTFERLGSNQPRPMQARVICATHRDLKELVKTGDFRLDLYYRLNTVELNLPPLRERRDDVALLANQFLAVQAKRHNSAVRSISPAALAALEEYNWPGNIRELQNIIERAVVITNGPEIRIEDLPSSFWAWQEQEIDARSFEEEVRNFKRRLILRTLVECDNNKVQTARSLKIARSSLHRLIDELDITAPRDSQLMN